MRTNETVNFPGELRCEFDPSQPGTFRLVDDAGAVWASQIPSAAAARVFGGAPALLKGYAGLLEEAHACFRLRFNLEHYDPYVEDFAEDDGELEERFPGAPELARWLLSQSDLYDLLSSALPA